MCGLSRNKADGAALNSWSQHNTDWEINPLRCPLYLHYLANKNIGSHPVAVGAVPRGGAGDEMPVAWPNNAQAALDLFHKERVLREMQKLVRFTEDPEKTHALMLATMPGDQSFVNKLQTVNQPVTSLEQSISLTSLDILTF
jgi:hypothetical protein